MTERWVSIAGYEGRYEVSDLGCVRSLDRAAPHNTAEMQRIRARVLTPTPSGRGYLCVGLRTGKKSRRFFSVSRLVASAFVSNPEAKPNVNHIDNNISNNAATNLEWCTQAENLAHMTRQGRRAHYWEGQRGPRESLTDETAAAIRQARAETGASYAAIARQHGTSKRTVQRIINGETYVRV